LVGDLSPGTKGAEAIMCKASYYCQNEIGEDLISVRGSCAATCKKSKTIECSKGEFGNRKGPLCYVGTFGLDAQMKGCGLDDQCQVI
jgi:hypothetical protein